jgi:hypothetical protein
VTSNKKKIPKSTKAWGFFVSMGNYFIEKAAIEEKIDLGS